MRATYRWLERGYTDYRTEEVTILSFSPLGPVKYVTDEFHGFTDTANPTVVAIIQRKDNRLEAVPLSSLTVIPERPQEPDRAALTGDTPEAAAHEPWCSRRHTGHCVDGPATEDTAAHAPDVEAVTQCPWGRDHQVIPYAALTGDTPDAE